MIALALAAAQVVASVPPPTQGTGVQAPAVPPAVPLAMTPPVDWSGLPALRWRRPLVVDDQLSRYVRDEVEAGRCAARLSGTVATVTVELVALVTGTGELRRIVPRAMGCSTVEQYATGLLSRSARRNLLGDGGADQWRRTAITFAWSR